MTDNNSHEDEMNRKTQQESAPADGSVGERESAPTDERDPRDPITVPDKQPRNTDNRRQDTRRPRRGVEDTKQKIVGYLFWGTFGAAFLFGAFAAFGFYQSVIEIIDIWVSEDFEPIFRAVFNLVVVLIAILGISLLIRRLGISLSPLAEDSAGSEE